MGRRVALLLEGSRGDAQPYVAAALALKDAGYEILILGDQDVADLAKQNGLTYKGPKLSARAVTTTPAVVEAITANDYAKLSKAVEAIKGPFRPEIVEIFVTELIAFRAEVILSARMCLIDSLCLGKALQIPVMFLGLFVAVPSKFIPALGLLPLLPSCINWYAWKAAMGTLVQRKQTLVLPILAKRLGRSEESMRISWEEFTDHCSCRPRFPVLFAVSPALHHFPPDFTPMCRTLGPLNFKLHQEWGPEFGQAEWPALEAFLKRCSSKPVYMGFGSMIYHSGKFMSLLSLRALMSLGQFGVIASGWAELSADFEGETDAAELTAFCKEKVLFVKACPHRKLFPQCSVIVHHGGAGTTYAAAMSGVPQVVVPVFTDQYFHSDLVNAKAVGVGLKSMRTASPSDLAAAIRSCDSLRENASKLAAQLAEEDAARRLVTEMDDFFVNFVDNKRYFEKRPSEPSWWAKLGQLCCSLCK